MLSLYDLLTTIFFGILSYGFPLMFLSHFIITLKIIVENKVLSRRGSKLFLALVF